MTQALVGRPRWGDSGFTLVEMLMVMVLMGIVMGSLTTVFVSGSRAQLELDRYFHAQQQARTALDRIRADVHCAWGATASSNINGFPGLKLEDHTCYTSTPTITWCVLPSTALTGRYALWRSTINTSSTCTSTDAHKVLIADYLRGVGNPASANNILTTPTIAFQGVETVGVDFKVSTNPTASGQDTYELTDSLVTRNYGRCTASSSTYSAGSPPSCSVPVVP